MAKSFSSLVSLYVDKSQVSLREILYKRIQLEGLRERVALVKRAPYGCHVHRRRIVDDDIKR